jgi:SAM-dependent methyltransferase
MTRWQQGGGADYAARFAALAASGAEMHGEADLVCSLVPPGSRVLDAGCGTGRVAIELRRRGYDVLGVDVDESMLAEARRADPDGRWIRSDLATLDLTGLEENSHDFDLVVCAGNVVPLVAPGTEPAAVARMAEHLRPGGILVAGFGLDRAHLPREAAVLSLDDYDAWCSAAGLILEARYATWDRQPWTPDTGYAVSVSRRLPADGATGDEQGTET